MNKDVIELAAKLIAIPSIKESPDKLHQVLSVAKQYLRGLPFRDFESKNIPSVLFYNNAYRSKKGGIILNAHLDVVPARPEQFNPYIKNGRLYGRGSLDMKAAATVLIVIFKELAYKTQAPLGLQLVTDEEVGGHNGAKYQLDKGVRCDFIIAGEPTDLGINNKAKGIIWAKIKPIGKTAHGAYPWQGENALWKAVNFLKKIEQLFPVPKKEAWKTTINLATIECTNKTFNKVPDDCTIFLDIRYIPQDYKTIVSTVKKLMPKNSRLEIIMEEPAQITNQNNPHLILLGNAVKKITGEPSPIIAKHGGSDIRHYNNLDIPGVTFGPIGEGLHTDNEWVSLESLASYYHILKEFLK